MTSFAQLSAELTDRINVPPEWQQGRTAYGGLSAGLLLAAIEQAYARVGDDVPPLRSVQVTFIAPLNGTLHITHRLLRRGKNTCIIEGEIMGETMNETGAGRHIGLKAIFIFGKARPFSRTMPRPLYAPLVMPEEAPELPLPQGAPEFLQHFETRFAGGVLPFSDDQSAPPRFALWMRHRDMSSRCGTASLLALADAPPAVLTRWPERIPLSSMNWHINFYGNEQITKDGWWLLDSETDYAADGYTAQLMMIYNVAGERVADATQHIAIFDTILDTVPDKQSGEGKL